MNSYLINWNNIKFNFNQPIEETWYIKEDFNIHSKISYATIWIQELLNYDNDFMLQIIIWKIFNKLYEIAKTRNLDYLQILEINGNEVWCVDNWDTICLLIKEEY